MDRSLRRLAGAGLLALVMAGCAGPQGVFEQPRESLDPQQLLSKAQSQSAREAALTRLKAADILARSGDETQALQVAANIASRQLPEAQRREWALLLSSLGLSQKDGQSVLEATALLDETVALAPEDRQTLGYRRGLALGMMGSPLEAAETLIALQKSNAPFDLNDAIWRQLTRLRGQSLERLAGDPGRLTQGWVALVELQRRHGGEFDQLFDRLEQWRENYRGHPAARRLPSDLHALQKLRRQGGVRHIAVFLPESGPLANVADALRKGMRARHMSALDQGEKTPRLSFYDTREDDLDTLYARAEMAGAQVVIGPLDKDLVSQLEVRNDVPILTLALNYGTADTNHAEGLFQYGLSAEDEARQAARRALRDGHRLAGMLVPDNPWGERVATAFRTTWQERGGRLAKEVHYNPEATVASAVEPLLDVRDEHARRDMDMLFLLALPDYARQVPPLLEFYYAGETPIYGTSHLYAGRPQPQADHDLDGVYFVEIPWLIPDAAVGGADALPFVDSYRKLDEDNDAALLKLTAMGVDAYELGRKLPVFDTLPSSRIYGATGTLTVDGQQRIQRRLPWARFVDGVPQPPLYDTSLKVTADGAP